MGGSRRSLLEYLVSFGPCIMWSMGSLYPLLYYFIGGNIPILWISIFPVGWRNAFTVSICLSLELLMFFIYSTWVVYILFFVLSFIMTFTQSPDYEIKRIR